MPCAFNLTGDEIAVTLPAVRVAADSAAPFAGVLDNGVAELPPYQGLFALAET